MPPQLSSAATYRPAVDGDREVMRAFIAQDLATTPYGAVVEYFLRLAIDGPTNEFRAIVAERAGTMVGFVLFGEVAGTIGTGRVHFVSVTSAARRDGVDTTLCEAAVAELRSNGARLVVAEVPDERLFLPARTLIDRCGFAEIGRVADYFRDDTDLVVLARTIPDGTPREGVDRA